MFAVAAPVVRTGALRAETAPTELDRHVVQFRPTDSCRDEIVEPVELLYAFNLLGEETIQAIVEARLSDSDDPNRNFATWLLVEGLVNIDQMRVLAPLLTGGGDVYRAQIIGYFENLGASSRAEVIIDGSTVNPKLVSWRDLSHLGRGFDLSVLGMRSDASLNP